MCTCKNKLTLARPLAPEDVRPGQYVTILYVVGQHLPTLCTFQELQQENGPARLLWLPEGSPVLTVIDVCLPQILAEDPLRGVLTLDARQVRLARLRNAYARKAIKALRECEKAQRRAECW